MTKLNYLQSLQAIYVMSTVSFKTTYIWQAMKNNSLFKDASHIEAEGHVAKGRYHGRFYGLPSE